MGDVVLKELDPSLKANEIPKEFISDKTRFFLSNEYFSSSNKCSLPKMYKKG